jgi:nicotinamidase-related amidase
VDAGDTLESEMRILQIARAPAYLAFFIRIAHRASSCVRAICVDVLSSGFIPIVVSDACGDRHESPHKANLFDMQAKYAEVWTEKEVCDYLNASARTTS